MAFVLVVTSLMFLSIISGNDMHHLLNNIKRLCVFHTHCLNTEFFPEQY